MDSASHGTKIVPLTPLGAEKLAVRFLNLTKHFWKRGGLPHPQFLQSWKGLTELYKPSEFDVSRPRIKKMLAAPLKSTLASVYEFIKNANYRSFWGGRSSKVQHDGRDISQLLKRDCAIAIDE